MRCVLQVKWRGLEYEECTWEMEGDLEDYMHLVQAFIDRERHGEKDEGSSNTPPPPSLPPFNDPPRPEGTPVAHTECVRCTWHFGDGRGVPLIPHPLPPSLPFRSNGVFFDYLDCETKAILL